MLGARLPHLYKGLARPGHICARTRLAPATSTPRLVSPPQHLQQDWACPCHICTTTWVALATFSPGLGSPIPHLQEDWAYPCHVCTGTGLAGRASMPRMELQRRISRTLPSVVKWPTQIPAAVMVVAVPPKWGCNEQSGPSHRAARRHCCIRLRRYRCCEMPRQGTTVRWWRRGPDALVQVLEANSQCGCGRRESTWAKLEPAGHAPTMCIDQVHLRFRSQGP
jgi:hypothetical protein